MVVDLKSMNNVIISNKNNEKLESKSNNKK